MYFLQTIREILLLGHRQAFAWIDDWISMTIADVRTYECEMQRKTNTKVNACASDAEAGENPTALDGEVAGGGLKSPKSFSPLTNLFSPSSSSSSSPGQNNTSWFNWWWFRHRTVLSDYVTILPIHNKLYYNTQIFSPPFPSCDFHFSMSFNIRTLIPTL